MIFINRNELIYKLIYKKLFHINFLMFCIFNLYNFFSYLFLCQRNLSNAAQMLKLRNNKSSRL